MHLVGLSVSRIVSHERRNRGQTEEKKRERERKEGRRIDVSSRGEGDGHRFPLSTAHRGEEGKLDEVVINPK